MLVMCVRVLHRRVLPAGALSLKPVRYQIVFESARVCILGHHMVGYALAINKRAGVAIARSAVLVTPHIVARSSLMVA